ncbi:transporter [Hymenobacter sedentarius]|uniref:transporter n=1 Tax=Hymenobacter sedentarius TaxID=1411621 RepID=UPI000AE3B5DB|nr:transporter [Hymenobacter sedentarius]
MRKTTLLAVAALLSSPGLTLAQNTPEENNPNVDAPFVRNIRADRPGQTITAQVLQPGRFQLEVGTLRTAPSLGPSMLSTGATLRVGFFNSMELRVTQPYFHNYRRLNPESGQMEAAPGWAPVVVGAKFMISPNYDTRTQVALLVESPIPNTGSEALAAKTLAPSARLLVSEQLGQRYGIEANFGFSQPGMKAADIEKGQFLGTLALNGAITNKTGFFVEAYGTGRSVLTSGTTAGLYWRPVPQARVDINAGRVLGGPASGTATLGAGLTFKLGQ